MIRCGLCNKEVTDWEQHVLSKEHIENLGNNEKLQQAFKDSQDELLKTIHENPDEQGLEPSPLLKKNKSKDNQKEK